MEIMTPSHPLWDEFAERLNAAMNACECDDSEERPVTRAILECMPNIDVEGSLAFFEEHDGYCDCDVLYRVVGCMRC